MRILVACEISIHPPPARWDWSAPGSPPRCPHFNPPTSCEVGPCWPISTEAMCRFQSTHLLRGGTCLTKTSDTDTSISIHPPPARWDESRGVIPGFFLYFNPPTSCEVGPLALSVALISLSISIHPPSARWDCRRWSRSTQGRSISIHPPPARWDLARWRFPRTGSLFQSTHLLRGGTRRLPDGGGRRPISIHPPPARWDPQRRRHILRS